MQGLHKRPVWVCKSVGRLTRFGWTLLLLCTLGSGYVYGSDSDLDEGSAGALAQTGTTGSCAVPVVNGGDPIRLNEPSLMAQFKWLELSTPTTVQQLISEAPFNTAVNWQLPVTTMPLTAENMIEMYRRGFKLYQFHNRNTPNHVEVHQYQHNRFRGILTFDNFARAMTNNLTVRGFRDDNARKLRENVETALPIFRGEPDYQLAISKLKEDPKLARALFDKDGNLKEDVERALRDDEVLMSLGVTEHILPGKNTLKGFKEAMYPHKVPRRPGDGLQKNHPGLMDMSRPAFEVRFNTDVALLLQKCGEAERRDIDAVSKVRRVDENGHTLMSTSTWFTPEVQAVVQELVETGYGYTIGVYTTKDHPWVIQSGEAPGKLVGGIASIHVDGVSTGLTLFMDRTRGPQKPSGVHGDYVYDSAGKLAFVAEVMHTFQSGARFLDTVTVNEAARVTGSVLVEREVYMQHVQEAHANPAPLHVPVGVYELPFDQFEPARFYTHLGLEQPRQNVSKKESNKDKRARGENPGQQPPSAQLPTE